MSRESGTTASRRRKYGGDDGMDDVKTSGSGVIGSGKTTISSRFKKAISFSRKSKLRTGASSDGSERSSGGKKYRTSTRATTTSGTKVSSRYSGDYKRRLTRGSRTSRVSSGGGVRRRASSDDMTTSKVAADVKKSSKHGPPMDAVIDSSASEDSREEMTQEVIAAKMGLDHLPTYRCDEKGYIHFDKGLLVHDQFVLLDTLGRGTFSKVFETVNLLDGRKYALKMIRNSHRYIEAAKTELRVLKHITTSDAKKRSCCIHLKDHFNWNKHPCLVFKLYGPSIYAIMSKNHYRPFPSRLVRDLSVQICAAIQFLHHLGIIFTDLKPENIVFVSGKTKPTLIAGKTHYLPVDARIKVVDFGSAVYEPVYDPHSRGTWRFRNGYNYLIQTRHYRAPEVVLEMCWKRPVDMWSIGCVVLEFLHGSMVFNTHCPIDHLNQMQAMIGPIPHKLIEQASERKMYELFHPERYTLRLEAAKRSRAQANKLSSYFNFGVPEYKALYDLVSRMLQWYAADRIDVDQMMAHEYWLISHPDRVSRKTISSSATSR